MQWTKPVPGRTPREKVADMIGKIVDVPGHIFGVDVPGLVYRGKVLGPDTSHQDAALVLMYDDNNQYYFPDGQVREWLEATQHQHADKKQKMIVSQQPIVQQAVSEQSDEYVAEVLTAFHTANGQTGNNQDANMQHTDDLGLDSSSPEEDSDGYDINMRNQTVYTAQATSMAVLAAFELGFRMAYNLARGPSPS